MVYLISVRAKVKNGVLDVRIRNHLTLMLALDRARTRCWVLSSCSLISEIESPTGSAGNGARNEDAIKPCFLCWEGLLEVPGAR